MKRMLICLWLLLLLLCALPAQAETYSFSGRVCEDAPLLTIVITDTGEVDPDTDDKLLRADISAEDGSLSQTLIYHAFEMPRSVAGPGWLEDLNFDGYADLCLMTVMGARNARTAFALWNPETGCFDEVYTEALYLPEEGSADAPERSWLSNYNLYPDEKLLDCYMADGITDHDWTVYRWEGRRLQLVSAATLRSLPGDLVQERVWRLDGAYAWQQTCPLYWYEGVENQDPSISNERREVIRDVLMGREFPQTNTCEAAVLYNQDSEESAVLAALPKGAAVQLLKADCGRDGSWARVLYVPAGQAAQLTGYVRMAQLEALADQDR